MMQTDDVDRLMSMLERALTMTSLIPIIWFFAIITQSGKYQMRVFRPFIAFFAEKKKAR
ncbi:hypothetical protein [Marinobacter caseinilyticus]|uniref:hypothetical protein n=1 Tax=Marinobacter caseinilyticus TaxID=2692195 RepID=UPI00140A2C79|nr:hypothetical protein [Marinobacter caseinilyticus]